MLFLQLDNLESQDAMTQLFQHEGYQAALLETGYRKPLLLADKGSIARILKSSVVLRVSAELDQFAEGLKVCGVLEKVREYPGLMAPYFTVDAALAVTKGACNVERGVTVSRGFQ